MTEDILIAVSEGSSQALDRQDRGALDGMKVETNLAGLKITAGDYYRDDYEDKNYYQTELSIPWADVLKHAPAEALLEAAKQKMPAPKTEGRLTNADCINWGILTDLDMILCDEGPLEYKEDLIRWVTGRIRDRYYDIEIPPGDPPASTP